MRIITIFVGLTIVK